MKGLLALLLFLTGLYAYSWCSKEYPLWVFTKKFTKTFPEHDEAVARRHYSEKILKAARINDPIPESRSAKRFKLLINGEASWYERIKALEGAKKSILVQHLIMHADSAGLQIAEILKQKKREGLDVRVIIDAFSNPDFPAQTMYFDLQRHGIDVEGFETGPLEMINELKVKNPIDVHERYHEKFLIVDDEIVITGGMNIGKEYFRFGPGYRNRWRDQDLLMQGKDAVAPFVDAFNANWSFFKAIKEDMPQ